MLSLCNMILKALWWSPMICHWSILRLPLISNIRQMLPIFFLFCWSVLWNIHDNPPFHYASMFANQNFMNSYHVILFCMFLLSFSIAEILLEFGYICFICVGDFIYVINLITLVMLYLLILNTSGWK